MADGQGQSGQQQFSANDYYLKQQAARMLSAIQKGYNENFQTAQVSMPNSQASQQVAVYMNHQVGNSPLSQQQQQPQQQQQQQHQQQQTQQQGHQSSTSAHNIQVQHQQLQHQLQQVQQAQQQFQQMQQLAQMQQQFQQQYNTGGSSSSTTLGSASGLAHDTSTFSPSRRGRKPTDKRKRKRHTFVKRPTTAYLYFVSKYRETLKEAGEVVPKAKIITQACAEKWRHMTEDEKEPFLELARRDRERWEQDKSLEKRPRDPNRPKRPPSAYFLFLADFRKSYPNKTDPAKEITKKAGERWNSLSDQAKTPYYRNAQVERAKWEMDLEKYKQSQKGNAGVNASVNRGLTINPAQQVASSSAVSSPSPGANVSSIPSLLAGQGNLMAGAITTVTTPESPSPVNAGMSVPQQQSPQGTSQTVYAYQAAPHMLSGSQATNLQFHAAR